MLKTISLLAATTVALSAQAADSQAFIVLTCTAKGGPGGLQLMIDRAHRTLGMFTTGTMYGMRPYSESPMEIVSTDAAGTRWTINRYTLEFEMFTPEHPTQAGNSSVPAELTRGQCRLEERKL